MRRKDKQADNEKALEIIHNCDICRIALCDGGMPYIVSMNFGFEFEEEALVFYFHSANEGKKLDIIRKNGNACFEMDRGHRLSVSDSACQCSMAYESVVGFGQIEILTDREEKRKGLLSIMKKYSPKNTYSFTDKMVDSVTVLKLTAGEYQAKVSRG